MSFDIIVVKLRRKVTSLLDVTEGDVEPLGTSIEIRQSCLKLFPQARWETDRYAQLMGDNGAAFEIEIGEGPRPINLHLTLRFGASWNDTDRAWFDSLMDGLWFDCGWQAFALSDNSALSPSVERRQARSGSS